MSCPHPGTIVLNDYCEREEKKKEGKKREKGGGKNELRTGS